MVDSKVALNGVFSILSLVAALLSIYLLKIINFGRSVKSFRKSFVLLLLTNLIQSLSIIYILLFYLDLDNYTLIHFELANLSGFLANIQLLLIVIANIEILKVYSVLNPRIIHKKLDIFRTTAILAFVALVVLPRILFTFYLRYAVVANVCIGLYAFTVVIYDNFQNFYLIYAVYNFKESRLDSQITKQTILKFKELIGYIMLMMVIDWMVKYFNIGYWILCSIRRYYDRIL